jgi:hypothetical protein
MFSIRSFTFLFTSINDPFVFLSPQPVIQVIFTSLHHEHQAQHLENSDIKSNQVSEQDKLSTMDIHQEDHVD